MPAADGDADGDATDGDDAGFSSSVTCTIAISSKLTSIASGGSGDVALDDGLGGVCIGNHYNLKTTDRTRYSFSVYKIAAGYRPLDTTYLQVVRAASFLLSWKIEASRA